METLIINVPDEKSSLVKQLLKELGVKIQNKTKVKQLAEEINLAITQGKKPDMDEIVSEIRAFRRGE